jgi:acyl-CoA reductase-like NAD-dependent aldehyde dehydrogenase
MNATMEPAEETAIDKGAQTRDAQLRWAQTPLTQRLHVIRELRRLIAENAEALAIVTAEVSARPIAEKLVSEVLPLADACHWLERGSARVLAPRHCGRKGRPLWMQGVSFTVLRQPFGIVLVIGPGNYPLFLPAVHSLHALVAGNAVLLKPAPGTREVALLLARLTREAGLDPALLTVLDESIEAAHDAIALGVDKVIFTGSSGNGRDLLSLLAETNTPSVMELSGQDAVLVFADADLDLVVRALRFAARLNNGETCIAPRRLIVARSVADDLLARLEAARVPRLLIERVGSEAAAVDRANAGKFALGASIFTRDTVKARATAARLKTGFVIINDIIVPTADPRMPFGGVKASGFGTTRGDEGLIEMTFPHVVAVRRGRIHAHLDEPSVGDIHLFTAYIRAAHGRRRLAAIGEFFGSLIEKIKIRKTLS